MRNIFPLWSYGLHRRIHTRHGSFHNSYCRISAWILCSKTRMGSNHIPNTAVPFTGDTLSFLSCLLDHNICCTFGILYHAAPQIPGSRCHTRGKPRHLSRAQAHALSQPKSNPERAHFCLLCGSLIYMHCRISFLI